MAQDTRPMIVLLYSSFVVNATVFQVTGLLRCQRMSSREKLILSRFTAVEVLNIDSYVNIQFVEETTHVRHIQTQTDADRRRQTQTDAGRHRQTQADTDRHRQTQTGSCVGGINAPDA